jgi:small subunit ribosomal protein S21
MISVKVHDNNVGKAISKLKNILVNEGLFKELKDRKHYVKPSLKKKLKREEAEKQRQRDFKKEIKSLERDDFLFQ